MAVGSRMAAAGQWVLNAALTANPIGIVVMAVAGLIAGLVYLYNTCEPVRAAFDAAFSWIGEKAAWVGSKLRAVGEWLGIVDEADDKADAKLAEATTTGVAPTTAALPPMPAAAPKEWNPSEALSGLSPEATAAFPGMAGGMAGGMSSSDMSALSGASAPAFNLTFSLNGMPDADFGKRVIDGLKRRQGELESLIASIVDEQRRLAYD